MVAQPANIPEADLQRFARLAAPLLQGTATRGLGPRAARNRAGPGLEFLDVRYYQPGDDIRHIDWRQSSRRQQTVVRRFRDESAADWFICVDCSASVRLHDSKWRIGVQLASALAYALLFTGHRAAVLLFSDRIHGFQRLGRGAHHYAKLLHLLLRTDVENASGTNLGLCLDHVTRDSNVFVISDFLKPDGMRVDLRSLRAGVSSVNALQVLARNETDIAANGLTRLQDCESGESEPANITKESQDIARRALASHCERLRRNCATLDIGFASCESEDSWDRVLLAYLHARA